MFVAVDLGADQVWYGALRITQYKFFYSSPGAHTMESRDGPSPAKAVSHAIAAMYEIPLPPVGIGLGTFKLPVHECRHAGRRHGRQCGAARSVFHRGPPFA